MIKVFLLQIVLSLAFFNAYADYEKLPDRHVHILAADSLEGRYPGSVGGKKAAEYIRQNFRDYGLTMLNNDGFQSFSLLASVSPDSAKTQMQMNGASLILGKDFTPVEYSDDCNLSEKLIELAFVGYGFNIDETNLKYNDYDGIDVTGKWVIILRGDPEMEQDSSIYIKYTNDNKKVLEAKDQNVAGVFLVSSNAISPKDELSKDGGELFNSGVPVVQITREMANIMLAGTKQKNIDELEKKLNDSRKPNSFSFKAKLGIQIKMQRNQLTTQNIVAIKKANNSEEYIVVGAHYDHLGYGGSHTGSLMPDTVAIHNGADDNASGVAAILEIARLLKDVDLDKNIIFVAFGAEETGMHGSKYFTDNPPVALDKIKLMINLDMVGNLDELTRKFSIGGVGTWKECEPYLKKYLPKYNLDATFNKDGFGPSDHSSFYTHDIPVLFLFTGTHDRYHKPWDDTEFINFDGLKNISLFTTEIVKEAAAKSTAITFEKSGDAVGQRNRRVSLKVTLGIIPDHTSKVQGLRVDDVRPDRPAAMGGMQKGDVIVGINGKAINNIYDYMHRLGKMKKGERINVEVVRSEKKIILIIDL